MWETASWLLYVLYCWMHNYEFYMFGGEYIFSCFVDYFTWKFGPKILTATGHFILAA